MPPIETNPEFEVLLDYLKHSKGCDLTGYKRSTLMRRFRHRMQSIHIDEYQSYLEYLQRYSEEYLALLNDVLINVTSFFRDREAWDYLATDIIPKIIASKPPDEPIRVWSAGCAAGQEVYSLLMLLADALGVESCLQRVQCYATDADETALQQARQATYSSSEITGIPSDLLSKYFNQTEQGYVLRSELRRTVIFGRHDLSQDAPMSRIDLLLCRNVLIYFNIETQASILARFHFALKNMGFLFLGRSETLIHRRQIFTPVNLSQKVYTKGLNLGLQDQLSLTSKSRKAAITDPPAMQRHFWQTAFEASPVAQFAVDRTGRLISANQQAALLFGLSLDDWNRPFQDLEPGKLLRSHIAMKSFYRNCQPVTLENLEWETLPGKKYFDAVIVPVFAQNQFLGITLTLLDISDYKQRINKLNHCSTELERVSETLRTTETELEAAQQEIKLLSQDILFKD